jgi:hypothetical protein
MAMLHLARIAYASALPAELDRAELGAMLSRWRRGNARRGITGLFLYHRASVFQLLEGFPDVIGGLYETIARDPGHHFVAKLIDEPIAERSFGDWSMGHARVAHGELGTVGALRPLLDPSFRYWHCNEGMAGELVSVFTSGPWRRSIS